MKLHLTIKREGSSWNGWCVHYAGMMKPGASLEKQTRCNAGVEYESVKSEVEFTYSYEGEKTKYSSSRAFPCFKREHHLTKGCDKCRFPNAEEIKAHEEEATGHIKKIMAAHQAIIEDLERRRKAGDAEVKINTQVDDECFEEGTPTNYVSGKGIIDCPVCKTGKLHYSRASYNGHVHARCSTLDCVSWMQ